MSDRQLSWDSRLETPRTQRIQEATRQAECRVYTGVRAMTLRLAGEKLYHCTALRTEILSRPTGLVCHYCLTLLVGRNSTGCGVGDTRLDCRFIGCPVVLIGTIDSTRQYDVERE